MPTSDLPISSMSLARSLFYAWEKRLAFKDDPERRVLDFQWGAEFLPPLARGTHPRSLRRSPKLERCYTVTPRGHSSLVRTTSRRVQKYKRTLSPARRAVAEFIYHYYEERNHQGLGNAFVFLDTTGFVVGSVIRLPNRWLRCFLLVMCTDPFAKKVLTLHFARSEGHERYFGCNLMHRKVLASSS